MKSEAVFNLLIDNFFPIAFAIIVPATWHQSCNGWFHALGLIYLLTVAISKYNRQASGTMLPTSSNDVIAVNVGYGLAIHYAFFVRNHTCDVTSPAIYYLFALQVVFHWICIVTDVGPLAKAPSENVPATSTLQ